MHREEGGQGDAGEGGLAGRGGAGDRGGAAVIRSSPEGPHLPREAEEGEGGGGEESC